MSFADLEAELNAAVMEHLKNVEVNIGGVAVDGIFDQKFHLVEFGGGVADTRPRLRVLTSVLPAEPVDFQILIGGVPYIIGEHEPDGSGMSLLAVERTQ